MEIYRIVKEAKADEVMYHERLLGFSFPITRSTAETFNALAEDALNWYNGKGEYSQKKEKTSNVQKVFREIVRIAQKKDAVVSCG